MYVAYLTAMASNTNNSGAYCDSNGREGRIFEFGSDVFQSQGPSPRLNVVATRGAGVNTEDGSLRTLSNIPQQVQHLGSNENVYHTSDCPTPSLSTQQGSHTDEFTSYQQNKKDKKRQEKTSKKIMEELLAKDSSHEKQGFLKSLKNPLKKLFGFSKVELTQNDHQNWRDFIKTKVKISYLHNGLAELQVPVIEKLLNDDEGVRTCSIGMRCCSQIEVVKRTILIIGETGAGKSTMTNGLINYLFDVQFDNPYRFRLVDPVKDRGRTAKTDADSQTEFINSYTLPCIRGVSKVECEFTIIDTPGFGDTRGPKRDDKLMEQIKDFFSKPEKYGVETIDAVCFIVKASTNKLTTTQKYIFDKVMSVFGKDIKDNIVVMVTFCESTDSRHLHAIKTLKASGIEVKKYFCFNNGCLYTSNGDKSMEDEGLSSDEDEYDDLSKMFWNLCQASFDKFFNYLESLSPKSLSMTANVLQSRSNLLARCKVIHCKIRDLCEEMDKQKLLKETLNFCLQQIDASKDFKRTTLVPRKKVSYQTEGGLPAINCKTCTVTCHHPCDCRDVNRRIQNCSIFNSTNGGCSHCKNECPPKEHVSQRHYYQVEMVPVHRYYPDMEEKHTDAKIVAEHIRKDLGIAQTKYQESKQDIVTNVKEAVTVLNRLSEIALRPHLISELQYLDSILADEIRERKQGYEDRVQILRTIHNQLAKDGVKSTKEAVEAVEKEMMTLKL